MLHVYVIIKLINYAEEFKQINLLKKFIFMQYTTYAQ